MTSRKSSGSMLVESAVEPTRSANTTVTWRRSASLRGLNSDLSASWDAVEAVPASSAIVGDCSGRLPSLPERPPPRPSLRLGPNRAHGTKPSAAKSR